MLVSVLVVYFVLNKLNVGIKIIILIIQGLLLVGGILAYQFQPVLGGVAIALGFGITLTTVLFSLSRSNN